LNKEPDAFRTISEVAEEIDVPQHVLRFWESRFAQIRPLKRGGGRRYYRPDDVDLLRGVRHLLYGEGYTIRGVQRILREQGLSFVQNVWRTGSEPPPAEFDEDKAGARGTEAAGTGSKPSFFELPFDAPPGEPPADRREPIIKTLQALDPNSDARRKLQAVLDDLADCRRVLDEALAASSQADD
jgi:DNA-binding transcriptional MerR regulator